MNWQILTIVNYCWYFYYEQVCKVTITMKYWRGLHLSLLVMMISPGSWVNNDSADKVTYNKYCLVRCRAADIEVKYSIEKFKVSYSQSQPTFKCDPSDFCENVWNRWFSFNEEILHHQPSVPRSYRPPHQHKTNFLIFVVVVKLSVISRSRKYFFLPPTPSHCVKCCFLTFSCFKNYFLFSFPPLVKFY